ncbi:MAG: methyl-accepting chemotaxis protein [Oligoflexia bacterium]|nr:methyl-accepting chemotaxis protein [Oligoflexia bacterium]
MIGNVEGIVRRKLITPEQKIQLSVYAALLKQSDLDRINGSAQTALNEDANFYGTSASFQTKVPPFLTANTVAMESFITLVKRIAEEPNVSVSPEDFLKAGDDALNASYRLWDVSVLELDNLLDIRTASLVDGRTRSLVFSAAALFATLCVTLLIMRSLKKNMKNISEAVFQLKNVAGETNSSSIQLVATSQELSSAATEQASAIQETAATLDEISAMVAKSVENANKSSATAGTSQIAANKGKSAVDDMIHAIEDINQSNDDIMKQVDASNLRITEIIKVIAEIGNKTKVINDIVFQTKLLSFNASVEAARAGEHGKGFAVVAEEVGNLAQMSGTAAREISDMLAASMQKVEGIVTETKTKVQGLIAVGKSKVESGTVVAKQCGGILEEIVTSVSAVNILISEILTASKEQEQGLNQITISMNQLDQVAHRNDVLAQSTSLASDQLSHQTKLLQSTVLSLEKIQHGSKAHAVESMNIAAQSGKPQNVIAFTKDNKKEHGPSAVNKFSKAEKNNLHEAGQTKLDALAKDAPMKKASGAENVTPAENDPRFKDV